jgi:hypothetical protein
LWSILISTPWIEVPLFLPNTARESPAFATIISVGVMMAEHAVQPAAKAISSVFPRPKRELCPSVYFLYFWSFCLPSGVLSIISMCR